jgi:hypothetical protein
MPKKNNAKMRASREKRSGANAPSDAIAALQESPKKTTPDPPALRLRRRRKRILMGEALRKVGLDELALAGNLSHVVETLKEKTDETGDVEKLLVDVLKECARHLDSQDAPALRGGSPSAAAPAVVHLVHNVSRPERPRTQTSRV